MKLYIYSNLENSAIRFAIRATRGTVSIYTLKDGRVGADIRDYERERDSDALCNDICDIHAICAQITRAIALTRHRYGCSDSFHSDGVLCG